MKAPKEVVEALNEEKYSYLEDELPISVAVLFTYSGILSEGAWAANPIGRWVYEESEGGEDMVLREVAVIEHFLGLEDLEVI